MRHSFESVKVGVPVKEAIYQPPSHLVPIDNFRAGMWEFTNKPLLALWILAFLNGLSSFQRRINVASARDPLNGAPSKAMG